MKTQISIEKMFPSGGWLISTIHRGQYIKMRYFGVTKKYAVRQFKGHLEELDSKIIVEVRNNGN